METDVTTNKRAKVLVIILAIMVAVILGLALWGLSTGADERPVVQEPICECEEVTPTAPAPAELPKTGYSE